MLEIILKIEKSKSELRMGFPLLLRVNIIRQQKSTGAYKDFEENQNVLPPSLALLCRMITP